MYSTFFTITVEMHNQKDGLEEQERIWKAVQVTTLVEEEGIAEHFIPLTKQCLNESQYCIQIGNYANVDMEQKIPGQDSRMGLK